MRHRCPPLPRDGHTHPAHIDQHLSRIAQGAHVTGLPQNPCTGLVFKRARLRGSTPGHATRISKMAGGELWSQKLLMCTRCKYVQVQACSCPGCLKPAETPKRLVSCPQWKPHLHGPAQRSDNKKHEPQAPAEGSRQAVLGHVSTNM